MTMDREHWCEIADWSPYRVSTLGRVTGKRTDFLTGYLDKNGYHVVLLRNGKRRALKKVHRLVVIAFIGPIPFRMQVNHKNGIKNDNRVENLEIVSASENMQHSFTVLGRIGGNTNPAKGERHGNATFTDKMVRQIRRLYATGRYTQWDLARKYSTGQNQISRIVRKETWKHVK